eukprot:Transcript_25803.p1 GENE.Transcript_25803~~Transcript_25803.p1  ORF type:complete len:199 (-),score=48.67 Transcript_25803:115-711(-)
MGMVKTFVMALAFRLRLSTAELVMAYAFVERALVVNPSLMRIYSVRPIFLGGCVLATKLTRDREMRMRDIYERIDDVLNTMDIRLLVKIEHQMLECLHWRFPTGDVYHDYARALFAAASQTLGFIVQPPPILPEWQPPPSRSPAALATALQCCARGRAVRRRLARAAAAAVAIQARLRGAAARRSAARRSAAAAASAA